MTSRHVIESSNGNKVPLQPDTTDDAAVTNCYYLSAASICRHPRRHLSLSGYGQPEYDNNDSDCHTFCAISRKRHSVQRHQFTIGAGFTRALTLQASDNAPAGPWQNISIENQNLSNGALGSVVCSGPSSIRISTTGAGTGTISSTAGQDNNMTVNVIAGLLTHIEITDLNQVHLTGTYQIGNKPDCRFRRCRLRCLR
ncbi:MAG: hypothetical protein U1F16_08145 [Turneriella sp.]